MCVHLLLQLLLHLLCLDVKIARKKNYALTFTFKPAVRKMTWLLRVPSSKCKNCTGNRLLKELYAVKPIRMFRLPPDTVDSGTF